MALGMLSEAEGGQGAGGVRARRIEGGEDNQTPTRPTLGHSGKMGLPSQGPWEDSEQGRNLKPK
jgi:hypothetical protein